MQCNDVHALKKAFHTKLKGKKRYQYLTIEKIIKEKNDKDVRYMDWLMEQFYSLKIGEGSLCRLSKYLDKYIEYLKSVSVY